MWVVFSAASFFTFGVAVVHRWMRSEASPPERLFAASSIGFLAWLATTWLFALLHLLNGPALILRTLAIAGVAAWYLWRHRAVVVPKAFSIGPEWIALFALVGSWSMFILWRGAILPPLSHDALAYHLPKAVLYERLGGFDRLHMLMANIRGLPANYEMLLADVIATTGSDRYTEWLSVITYAMFVSASAALASRWWPGSRHAAAITALFSAGVPVALLHSGTHKNDLMVAALMVGSCVWFGRWFATGERASLALFLTCTAAAIGTKPQAAALAAAFTPVMLWRLRKDRSRLGGDLSLVAVTFVLSSLLLGGVVYVSNFLDQGAAFSVGTRERPQMMAYGDWRNLIDGPWVLLTAPFSRDPNSLWMPWEPARWFWRRYEVYFSHMGIAFSIAAIAAVGVVLLRRRRFNAEVKSVTAACAVTFLLTLPVAFAMHGLYAISLPRYVLFVAPVVFALVAGSLAEYLERTSRAALSATFFALAGAMFCWYAVDTVAHDTFAPWAYVQWARVHEGTRVIPFDPNRAASVVDRIAGPDDMIAIDAGPGTWIHPAFGAALTRPVEFIQEGAGPVRLSDRVRWVAIDRASAVVWGHPDFRDLSEVRKYLMRGRLSAADQRVFEQLRRDPRFELVFYNPKLMQAVFRRADQPTSGR